MTIEREFFGFVVECDSCSNYENLDTKDFDEAIEEIKKKGWKFQKDEYGFWEHICPACLEKGESDD